LPGLLVGGGRRDEQKKGFYRFKSQEHVGIWIVFPVVFVNILFILFILLKIKLFSSVVRIGFLMGLLAD